MINKEFLQSNLGKFKESKCFIVGTASFLGAMKDILINEGVELPNIKEDNFG